MSDTHKDDGLDKIVKHLMVSSIVQAEGSDNNITESNLTHFTNHNLDFLEAKAKLLAWRDAAVKEARIDELCLLDKKATSNWDDKLVGYIDDRIADLQASKETPAKVRSYYDAIDYNKLRDKPNETNNE